MGKKYVTGIITGILISVSVVFIFVTKGCTDDTVTTKGESYACDSYGAPPIRTVYPVTLPLECEDGQLLSWQQGSAIRYACLNYPSQSDSENHKWPLIIYLHGSIVTPMSIYTFGNEFFGMRDTYPLSDNDSVKGFIILSPEGRIANPWTSEGPQTGEGFHWDEWYRDPVNNLDAQAIDHFLDEVISLGKVDTSRIYVFGWSNGAYMTVLYSTWRSSRIAAMGQYAGGNPWSRTPCPVPMTYTRKVPLFLMRNLCDALVPCDSSNIWISTLQSQDWPFIYHSLNYLGDSVSASSSCYPSSSCNEIEGLANHVRWPKLGVLEGMLLYFKTHPLP